MEKKNGNNRFEKKDILNIRNLYKTGLYTQEELGIIYDTSCSEINYIIKNGWRHV